MQKLVFLSVVCVSNPLGQEPPLLCPSTYAVVVTDKALMCLLQGVLACCSSHKQMQIRKWSLPLFPCQIAVPTPYVATILLASV